MASDNNVQQLEELNKNIDMKLHLGTKEQVYYFYVRVVDCRGILTRKNTDKPVDTPNDSQEEGSTLIKHGEEEAHEPFIEVKLNASESLHKKAKTKLHTGMEWWAQTFRFKINDVEDDWVALEVRDKGPHALFTTQWIGELQLKVRDFVDGKVHINWYKLGKGNWKAHESNPRGFVQLELQLLRNKTDKPFQQDPNNTNNNAVAKRKTFEEWQQAGMPMPGSKDLEPTATHKEEHTGELARHFELKYPNMLDAEHTVAKHYKQILQNENPTTDELLEMKKMIKVNCLHNGHFEQHTSGKRVMVAVDGTESSNTAFEETIKALNPETDHLFVVTVREIAYPEQEFDERSRVILSYKLWQAAAGILQHYMDVLKNTKITYTLILPESDDAREMVVALVKKYKADILYIGKHKTGERRHASKHFRSFERYAKRNLDSAFVEIRVV